MESNPLWDDLDFQQILREAEGLKDRPFSDLIDANGHQYVDLVQEGGGVLGIALAGYTAVLESSGIRFYSLAGTSAGAINTLMLAAMGPIWVPKSQIIVSSLYEKNLFDLVDGHKGVRALIKRAVSGKKGIGWAVFWRAFRIYNTLKNRLGLNPGDNFTKWIESLLGSVGIQTLDGLVAQWTQQPEGFGHRGRQGTVINAPRLVMIASEITTHTKVCFPEMAGLYWPEPGKVNPALFARASMAIPFFFEPLLVKDIPGKGESQHKEWVKQVRYYGPVPEKVRFVDGGMISNFPIQVFHREDGGIPMMPTFGVKLSTYREHYSNTDNFMGFNGAMLSTMRQIHDLDFLLRNPDYKHLICRIDADAEFNWLDFEMPLEEQKKLLRLGAAKALDWLKGFDWEKYKGIRGALSN